MSTIVWLGPVADFQIARSVPPGFALHVVSCKGDLAAGLLRCTAVADRWKDSDARRLPFLRQKLGIPAGEPLFLAAFSAGGSCVRRLLLDPRDRAEIAGVFLFDATYGEWGAPGVVKIDALQTALVDMAVECIADGRPFVATASSSPAGKAPTAADVLHALWAEIEERTGHAFAEVTKSDALAGLKIPVSAMRCHRVLFVDFGNAYGHAAGSNHAIAVAPTLLPRMVAG